MASLGIREEAVRYTMRILRTATDWQDGQTALYNHDYYGSWLREEDPDSPEPAQSIIREAEERLGNQLPY
jgi:hypothetical protein